MPLLRPQNVWTLLHSDFNIVLLQYSATALFMCICVWVGVRVCLFGGRKGVELDLKGGSGSVLNGYLRIFILGEKNFFLPRKNVIDKTPIPQTSKWRYPWLFYVGRRPLGVRVRVECMSAHEWMSAHAMSAYAMSAHAMSAHECMRACALCAQKNKFIILTLFIIEMPGFLPLLTRCFSISLMVNGGICVRSLVHVLCSFKLELPSIVLCFYNRYNITFQSVSILYIISFQD